MMMLLMRMPTAGHMPTSRKRRHQAHAKGSRPHDASANGLWLGLIDHRLLRDRVV